MAMNFFEHQEAARRSSRVLIALFVLAVIAIVIAVNAALAAIYFGALAPHGTWVRYGLSALPNYFFETTTAVVLLMIVGGTVQQILELRAGGEAVAQMVGARPVDPATRDPLERRLLNVIEEMSLASGIPAPRAYVLDNENGINAFAAGLHTSDAIVAVTRGTLTRLSRDELQGVMGHEFSHILNGDIGLNLRLIGVLQGLLLLALFGRFLTAIGNPRGRSRDPAASLLIVAGLAVLAIGYIGVFFGRLIKASVSRQREFLADASSVQFTRNPDGIGGALRKIGGLGAEAGGAVQHIHAETLSHMFMAPVSVALASGVLASHPPLLERLRRIYGRPVEYLPAEELPVEPEAPQPPLQYEPVTPSSAAAALASPLAGAVGATVAPNLAPAALHASIGKASADTVSFGAYLSARLDGLGLRGALADATQAQLLVLSMLLDTQAQIRERQLATAAEHFGSNAAPQIEQFARIIGGLPPGWRLPLLDLSMPALRTLAPPQRQLLLRLVHELIVADGRVTLAEFLLFSVLKRRLEPAVAVNGPGRALHLDDLGKEASVVMSLIACVRLPQEPQRAFDAGKALLPSAGPRLAQNALALAQVSAAFDRLALLAPLEKPLLIKACVAIAFIDGSSHWKAASCLRTLCAALDCPLPPQVEAAE
ncbi:MAG TPA: M48 family metalloprotease [Burkholderiaceae bacterium]|nr:M48 family metalloprotease [Burkholderiaceae bacterium]